MTARERARARALLEKLPIMHTVSQCGPVRACMIAEEYSLSLIEAALADAERRVWEQVMDNGDLWSFLRSVLSQGGAIQQDYQAGKYNDYEEYAARLDCAARERADQWIAQAIRAQADQEEA